MKFYLFLKSIDKGLYFPLFFGLTVPLMFFEYGAVIAYCYAFFLSFAHVGLLKIYPYVNDSDYYRYLALKKEYYLQHQSITPIFSWRVESGSYTTLLFVYYLSFVLPVGTGMEMEQLLFWMFPFYGVAIAIALSSITVSIINIVSRPRLPKSICMYHPFLQKRYGPITDILLNKILPVCARIGTGLFAGYSAYGVGFKALNGGMAIDPIRNGACNLYHGFPAHHKWTEASLWAWSSFKGSEVYSHLPYEESVKVFQANEKKLTDAVFSQVNPSLARRASK